MKPVNWSTEKDIRLKAERGVSFEEVLSAMSNGGILVVLGHSNTDQYPNQRMFVARIRGYAYARTGHGGNAQLRALLSERTNARNNLQFSVLQTLSPSLTAREVIAYEQLHKEKFGTRAHGLNSN